MGKWDKMAGTRPCNPPFKAVLVNAIWTVISAGYTSCTCSFKAGEYNVSHRRRVRMKVHYWIESSMKEDHVDVHYRKESETVEMMRKLLISFKNVLEIKNNCSH